MIIVADDGKGFTMEEVDKKGIGLSAITHNVSFLKGDLKIQSHLNEGTTITVRFPLSSDHDSNDIT
jgi:two-component system sensor histidine kinase DegS